MKIIADAIGAVEKESGGVGTATVESVMTNLAVEHDDGGTHLSVLKDLVVVSGYGLPPQVVQRDDFVAGLVEEVLANRRPK